MTLRRSWGWLWVAGLALLTAEGCSFDTAALDERRCSSTAECTGDQQCIDGICQAVAIEQDVEDDLDAGDVEANPCQDFDGDLVLGGVGCNATPLDCNDFDPAIHPGADEVCDGKDNDCDELEDTADDEYIEAACPLTQGVCAGSTRTCTDGELEECTAETYGTAFADSEDGDLALCDGLDNDCDGTPDENIRRDCYTGAEGTEDVGLCHGGTQACTGDDTFGPCEGEVVPVSEDLFETRCDALDNDCDGDDDEDCRCLPGEQRICYGIPGFDEDNLPNPPCRLGRQVCEDNNRFGDCTDEVLPAEGETCADPGIDNDCDGSIDPTQITQVPVGGSTPQSFGSACSTGLLGICAAGTFLCTEDGLECVPNNDPGVETCANPGADDDCDGTADNIPGEGDPCRVTTFGGNTIRGTCQFGALDCEGTALVCRPSSSRAEQCDGRDDDCNGTVDNGFDLQSSETHCGFCGNACGGTDETCCSGECSNVTAPTASQTADTANCGACGNDCFSDHPELGTQAAAERSVLQVQCCQDSCVDLQLDEDNCGACGNDCGTGTTCCDGGCTDTDIDELHCGGCNIACDAATEHCCGGACVPLDDPNHCGDCDTTGGGTTDRSCTASQGCCSVPLAEADGLGTALVHYACRPLNADPATGVGAPRGCGACGVDCDAFDLDLAGTENDADFACRLSPIGQCFDTLSDEAHCGTPEDVCTGAEACCNEAGNGICRDLDTDESNCGACGNICDGSEQCCGGVCVADDDPAHCGICGNVCTSNELCCTDPTPGNAFDCIDPSTGTSEGAGNRLHCGTCNTQCTGADDSCIDGFCVDTDCNIEHCGVADDQCDVRTGERCCATNVGGTCAAGGTTFACVSTDASVPAGCCGDGVCDSARGEVCAADCP